MAELKSRFEKLSLEFNDLQNNSSELYQTRSKLETQYQENKIVLEEFENLNEESKIYKLTGPVLLPQDYSEAKLNVSKRIEFIQDEIKRVEQKIEENEKNMEKTRDNLLEIRTKIQAS